MKTSMDTITTPVKLENPIAAGIAQHEFKASFDGSAQTFLEKDFGDDDSGANRLAFVYLHGALSHQEQGMTAEIYNGTFEKWGVELARRNAVYVCPAPDANRSDVPDGYHDSPLQIPLARLLDFLMSQSAENNELLLP